MEVSRRTLLASLASLTVLPAAACTTDDDAETTPGALGTAGATASPVPITIGVPATPTMADPALAVDADTHRATRQVLENLVGVDRNTGAPVPQLATDWTVSEDGLRYTFSLHGELTFHDGTAFTAETVATNFDRWARLDELLGEERLGQLPALAFPSVFGGFLGAEDSLYVECEPIGERTVALVLQAPIVFLPAALAAPPFAISSPQSWQGFEEALAATPVDRLPPARPAGTGPYRWGETPEDADSGSVTVLEPDADYRAGAPAVGPVTLTAVPDAGNRLRELRRTVLAAAEPVTPETLRPLVQGGAQVLQRDPFSVIYLGMNLQHPVLGQLYVRQAVAHAIDRGALVEETLLAGSSPAHEFVPPALNVQNAELTQYDYDPDEARRLLGLSGYDGQPLPFLYPIGSAGPSLASPEAVYARIAEDLAAVGLVLDPVPVAWTGGFLYRLYAGDNSGNDVGSSTGNDGERAFHLLGRSGAYRDPHHFLSPLFSRHSTEFGYRNQLVERNLRRAVSQTSTERRTRLYRQVAESLALDLPALPLAYPISSVAVGPRLEYYPTSPVLDERFDRITPVRQ